MIILQEMTPDYSDTQMFERHVREHARARQIRILEAGCGRQWELALDGINFELVGVDVNADSLRLRKETFDDLDESVVGDLRTVDLQRQAYDIVFCSFLLEHVAGAEQVLNKLFSSLKPGGLLLLRVPDRDGVYGWVARNTPHRLHVWYKRHIRKSKLAGTPGHGPFPVVYDRIISWRALNEYCSQRDHIILEAVSSNGHMDFFPDRVRPAVEMTLRAVAALSFGRLSADHANLALVVQKATLA
jgi:SAM-dependent methyltransferase